MHSGECVVSSLGTNHYYVHSMVIVGILRFDATVVTFNMNAQVILVTPVIQLIVVIPIISMRPTSYTLSSYIRGSEIT